MAARWLSILALVAATTAASGGAGMSDPPPVGREMAGPGTGLICIWAIYATLLEVGRRCAVPRNAAMETEVARSVSTIEAYARRRSPQRADHMAAYRARQIDGDAEICSPDAMQMYNVLAREEPATLRADADRLLASSPAVEWGTCL